MMIIKILYTVFVLFLNYLIYKKINEGKISGNHLILLAIYLALIIILNYIFGSVSNKLIFFLLLFSFSTIVLNFFKSFINVYQKSDLLDSKKVEKAKFIMLNVMMPIMITVYQVIIIWVDKLFDKMIK
ncbi:hypothetical protein [Flavobacterium psychrophilum]|uniref:hypothetical protein n=1 Tax=Flavobacterium psychrophilum TaxID=96345 RepID=UPI000A3B6CFA|nr:hypothetical protein [Flavobacterium psychrophilum]OUD23966.1 hypothetical protein FPG92_12835 [Flavobacterium psychrophilum]